MSGDLTGLCLYILICTSSVYWSRLGQLESNNDMELSKSSCGRAPRKRWRHWRKLLECTTSNLQRWGSNPRSLFARSSAVKCILTVYSFLVTSLTVEARKNFGKEFEENNCPTHRKWTFLLDWNFSEQLWRHRGKAITFGNTFDCRKTSKKNARYYSRDYYFKYGWVKI